VRGTDMYIKNQRLVISAFYILCFRRFFFRVTQYYNQPHIRWSPTNAMTTSQVIDPPRSIERIEFLQDKYK